MSRAGDAETMRERLRRATRALHVRVEDTVGLDRRLGSLDAYRALLMQLFGLHRPVETAFATLDWRDVGLDPADRRRSVMIEADLADLGLDRAAVAALPRLDLAPPASILVGLGWLYVLEGSTLGGQLIYRQAHQRLAVDSAHGGRFFAGYGAQNGAMWQACIAAIERVPARSADGDAVEAAAAAMFEMVERWLAPAPQSAGAMR